MAEQFRGRNKELKALEQKFNQKGFSILICSDYMETL